jgi:outer membrane protein assembly factor BamB
MTRRAFRSLLFVIPVFLLLLAAVLVRPTLPSLATSTSITLSLTFGPPTSIVQVKGKGFKASETVTLTFDTTQGGSVKASTTGSFSATIAVPSSAQPGNHFVQARGKSSGYFARAIFLVQTDWVQFGFNRERTRFNVFENVINTSNVSNLTQDWIATPGDVNYSSPAVANGIVYIGSYDGELYAFNAVTGTQVWSYNIGYTITSSPAVANGIVYIGSGDGKLYAFNASSGVLLWSYTTGKAIYSAPLTANGVIYVSSEDGMVYTLNATSGALLWRYNTGTIIYCSPSLDNGVLYISSGTTLYALKATTGVRLWSYTASPLDYLGNVAITNGVAYVTSNNYNLNTYKISSLNSNTGRLIWSYDTGGEIYTSPAVGNGIVYIGTFDDKLYALNATAGALLWSYTTGGKIYSSVTIANGVVYIGSDRMYALNATTGTLLWTAFGGYFGYSSPAVANGVVYVGSDRLYAFYLSGKTPQPTPTPSPTP